MAMGWWSNLVSKKEAADNSDVAKQGKAVVKPVAGFMEKWLGKKEKENEVRVRGETLSEKEAKAEIKRREKAAKKAVVRKEQSLKELYTAKSKRRQRRQHRIERERFGARGRWREDQEEAIEYFPGKDVRWEILQQQNLKRDIEEIAAPFIEGKSISAFSLDDMLAEFTAQELKFDDAISKAGEKERRNLEQRKKELQEVRDRYEQKMSAYSLNAIMIKNSLQQENTAWQGLDKGDEPNKTVRKQLVEIASENIEAVADKIPVLGKVLGPIAKAYGQLKVTISEITDATRNISAGTRRLNSMGRIFGAISGAIAGAVIMGGALAAAGSVVPIVGTAIGGVTGIIAGAIMGAAAGGPLGVKVFRAVASKNKKLKKELDFEMEYTQLKQNRKIYGFSEDMQLNAYSYLNREIDRLGKTESKNLQKLKKNSLEEGRDQSMLKLCVYFIGQEKVLRRGIHSLGMETIQNRSQRSVLLGQRRLIKEREADIEALQEQYEQNILPFIKKREALLNTIIESVESENVSMANHNLAVGSANDLMKTLVETKKISTEQIRAGMKRPGAIEGLIKAKMSEGEVEFGSGNEITEENMIELVKQAFELELLERELRDKAATLKIEDYEQSPQEKLIEDKAKIQRYLERNQKQGEAIQDRRFEMMRERDGILDILKEFRKPSEVFNKKRHNYIYHDLQKLDISGIVEQQGDPIGDLFEIKKDFTDKTGLSDTISKPRDVRSFDSYSVGGDSEGYTQEKENNEMIRAEFREDMRENAFRYAQEEASLHDDEFWRMNLSDRALSEISKQCEGDEKKIAILQKLRELGSETKLSNLIAQISASDGSDVVALNNKTNRLLGDLLQIQSTFHLPENILESKIDALQDIQQCLELGMIKDVYIRRDLKQHHESVLQELLPYSPEGIVMHTRTESGTLEPGLKRADVLQHMAAKKILDNSSFKQEVSKFVQKDLLSLDELIVHVQNFNKLNFDSSAVPMNLSLLLGEASDSLNNISKLQSELQKKYDHRKAFQLVSEAHQLRNCLNEIGKTMGTQLGAQQHIDITNILKPYYDNIDSISGLSIAHEDIQQMEAAFAHTRETEEKEVPLRKEVDPELVEKQDQKSVNHKKREATLTAYDAFLGESTHVEPSAGESNWVAAKPRVPETPSGATELSGGESTWVPAKPHALEEPSGPSDPSSSSLEADPGDTASDEIGLDPKNRDDSTDSVLDKENQDPVLTEKKKTESKQSDGRRKVVPLAKRNRRGGG
tara:strand:+ start:27522 stop:31262 length:3741 start_codon:yes stop_codon:yes gene_type:complete